MNTTPISIMVFLRQYKQYFDRPKIPTEYFSDKYTFKATETRFAEAVPLHITTETTEEGDFFIDPVSGKRRKVNKNKSIYLDNSVLQRLMELYHNTRVLVEVTISDKDGNIVYTGIYNQYTMSDELATAFYLISKKVGTSSCFRGYSSNDDMVSEAFAFLAKSAWRYKVGNEAKSANPFGYFTKLAHQTFRTYLAKENKKTAGLENYRNEKYPELIDNQLDGCSIKPAAAMQYSNDSNED
jgi:hypothetical protein